MHRRARAVSCAFVEGGETRADALREYLLTGAKEELTGLAGFVREVLYENLNTPWRCFSLHSWDSVRSFHAAAEQLSRFTVPLEQLEAALEVFEGVERTSFP